ncbi:MAG TPA: SDR family oxidoreductase [Pyrinomonadaceae bacterium]|nr:SDR family oxidoreductase [Pyrinomonadaceae bacterium]
MNLKLKKLSDQVIVITGASSGIGLVTARMAAKRGARVVLNARNEETLRRVTEEINSARGDAIYVAGDVGTFEDVQNIADVAIRRFGGFDTWINNAGVSIYGHMLDQSLEDHRRLFDTNYWGVVHGSMIACAHLRERGGALINVGSVLSDVAIPIQGTYCASKHAVKGYTDALRLELEEEGAPISVTLIKPSASDTPYTRHAKNLMPVEPMNPPPVYAPDPVAEAILHCAENPERDVTVGGGGKVLAEAGQLAPRLTDKVIGATMFDVQKSDQPRPANRRDSLYAPLADGDERGDYPGHVAESSLYTKATLHPLIAGSVIAGFGLAAWAGWCSLHGNSDEKSH